MLKLVNITKDYKVADGYVHALKGIDLEFRKNEFVCILGQSGCGKTTLLNVIGGLDHYTEGDLIIQGKSTKDFKDRDWDVYRNHRIGFIFQTYNLIPHQTVLGNVELALTIAGIPREERRQRAQRALERVGLGSELSKRPNQLSGGQMQRVAIARALVNDPDILLADEPTGALDSKTSVEVMDLIKEIAGERLVIMVTHNPELAEKYATRIVRLKDGLVESDSNPYTEGENEEKWDVDREAASVRSQKKEGKKARAKMSFLTSLSLSARNLLTKKGRTILTSVAGSIGIISVCLVLALSSGFNNYIKKTEEDMLSYYPLQITESPFDLTTIMAAMGSYGEMPDPEKIGDKVYVDSFLTGLAKGMTVQNNITQKYVDYIEEMDKGLYNAIQYSYGVSLVDNLFTEVEIGGAKDPDTGALSPYDTLVSSVSALKQFYIGELDRYAPQYSNLIPFANYFGGFVGKMPGTLFDSEDYGEFVLSQYDVIAGTFPEKGQKEKLGAALVVGNSVNEATDLILAQLGYLPEEEFLSLFEMGTDSESEKDKEETKGEDKDEQETYMTLPFEDEYDKEGNLVRRGVLGKKYMLYYNDVVYEENPDYVDMPIMQNGYPFVYQGTRTKEQWQNSDEKDGVEIEVQCILRLKEGYTYGCLSEGLNLTEESTMRYLRGNMNSKIVKFVNDNAMTIPYDDTEITVYLKCPAEHIEKNTSYYRDDGAYPIPYSLTNGALRYLGGVDIPNSISIYPRDFDSKEVVLDHLESWNEHCTATEEERTGWDDATKLKWEGLTETDKITYTDTVGLLMQMMKTMLDVITYVLVAFTAISLIVSSVMIGIITYVSVVERVKEIGVLRSLGARKRDIKNLFNAETFIIGLGAGLIGAAVTYLLEIPINAIIYSLSDISGIASLPILTAGIMVLISVVLTLISGLIPAAAAAKKDPVIALRTE